MPLCTSHRIRKLQSLRLLPPPCNEGLPLLSTMLMFSIVSLTVTDFSRNWKDFLATTSAFSETQMFVYGNFALYMTMYWGYSFLLHAAEHFIPALAHFKIQPEVPVTPWTDVLKMARLVLLNQIFLGIPMLKGLYLVFKWRCVDPNHVPGIAEFFGIMIANVLCTEVWFYCIHRLLHESSFLYKHVHYLHHQYKAPSCLESVYVHPVEFAINSFTVLFVGPIVTGAPLLVFYMWIVLCTFLQLHDHSGYWFPFLPRALMHDYHHQRSKACFGILGLLDGIFQTDNGFQEFVKKNEQGKI